MSGYDVQIELDRQVAMRDGAALSVDIYRPAVSQPVPALLCRTIYDNQRLRDVEWAYRFAQNGYAVVVQDCRGRYDSGGIWDPYLCEADDGYDTQQWLGAQAWCDGQIGMFGISYLGFTQVLPAPFRSPYVKALVPIGHQEDNFGCFYNDGVLQLAVCVGLARIGGRTVQDSSWALMNLDRIFRRLPLISALDDVEERPLYRTFLSHPTFDEYWKSCTMKGKYAEVDVPALFITGWYDALLHEVFKVFAGWKHQARTPATRALTKILVGPWTHRQLGTGKPDTTDFGPAAEVDMPGIHVRWYDRRLKGIDNGIDDEPAVRIFVMGANIWRDEHEWPLARTRFTPFYLHSRGRANSLAGDGELSPAPPGDEPADTFTYDPANPVPTLGGRFIFLSPSGPLDRRPVEQRNDVLVYTTAPLPADVEVTGPVELILHAVSSAVDTDFAATLVDVHPDGRAIVIADGMVRARFRESLERPTPLEPGRAHTYRISLWETSNVFKAGHRIRLEITSSNFPRASRNLNTGEDDATGTRMVVAHQTILHNASYPSHIVLPVIPA